MGRLRRSVPGGYVPKTISLPKQLADRLDRFLEARPGLTLSALISDACESFLGPKKKER